MRRGMLALSVLVVLLMISCGVCGLLLKNANEERQILLERVTELENTLSLLEDKNEVLIETMREIQLPEHSIDRQLEKAMSESTGTTTYEMLEIIYFHGGLWKDEMEQYYQLLFDNLDNEGKQLLVSSQEKWELFIEEDTALAWQTFNQISHMGSIVQLNVAYSYLGIYRSRALGLKHLYDNFKPYLLR